MQGNFESEGNRLIGAKGLWKRDSGRGGTGRWWGIMSCINVDERSLEGNCM